MRRRDHGLLTNASSLLICGLLAGVVVAAAAFPAAAISGLAAKAGAETFDKLPTELTVQRSPQISYAYASDGKTLIAMLYDENRRDIPLDQMSDNMQKAIIAAEDQNFFHHNGVDLKGIARAFVANHNAGETEQGASTLTMQYVRMAISYSARTPQEVVDATEDTNARKLREIRYAMAVEKRLTKQQILERYLNIAPFGNGAYGVFAASQVYFNKPPKDLTVPEAALLAGLVKAPSAFDPTDPAKRPDALDRRNWVIDQMAKTGAISRAEADAAKQTEIKVSGKRAPNGCTSQLTAPKWGFFCDYLTRWWLEQETFGANSYDRERRLKSGGYKIITSLDLKIQAAAQKHIDKIVKADNPDALMVAAVEPGTGRVQALAVNRHFKLDSRTNPQNKLSSDPKKRSKGVRGSRPNTTNPLLTGGGDVDGYQAGSTFKLFTMIAALENGYPLSYTINAQDRYVSRIPVEEGGPASCGHFYCVENANPSWMRGPRNMWTGFGRSVNTYFVPLEERVGPEKAVDVAKRLGIQFRSSLDAQYAGSKQAAHGWGAFTLGVSQTTPLDLANAYATIAADGKYCSPTPVREILDTFTNQKLDVANPSCHQAIDKDVARAAVDAARCPVGDQSAFGKCNGGTAANVHGIVKKPVFGKSGTTDSNRTAAFVAGTKQVVVGGILADPDWAQTTQLRQNVGGRDIHGQVVNKAVYETLADAVRDLPAEEFAPPPEKLAFGDQRSIPDVTCKPVDDARARLRGAGFDPEVSSNPERSNCPAGTVARTDPSGRTVKGGIVVVYVSSGPGAPPPGPGPTKPSRGVTLCPPVCRDN
ncbi:MAG: penicillin-binding protein [Micromonosporaceae bacterium]|jgi:membrane peptidoglycan carboxypeptidase|nr:penicillin-binding protein [Micromonosporaceae bacterium]